MASLPSDENPELAPGQQPINRGNINREIIDGELVDYGDSADEEEPAAQVAAAEGRQRQNAGQEAQRPAWARDFMQEVQTAIAGNTQRLNALMMEVRTPGTRPGAWRTARMQELHPAGETFGHRPAEEIFESRRINLPLDRPTQRSRPRVPSRIVRISHSPPPPEVRVPTRIVRVTPPNEVNPSQVEDDEDDPGALHPNDGEGNDPPLAAQATHQRGSRSSKKVH